MSFSDDAAQEMARSVTSHLTEFTTVQQAPVYATPWGFALIAHPSVVELACECGGAMLTFNPDSSLASIAPYSAGLYICARCGEGLPISMAVPSVVAWRDAQEVLAKWIEPAVEPLAATVLASETLEELALLRAAASEC